MWYVYLLKCSDGRNSSTFPKLIRYTFMTSFNRILIFNLVLLFGIFSCRKDDLSRELKIQKLSGQYEGVSSGWHVSWIGPISNPVHYGVDTLKFNVVEEKYFQIFDYYTVLIDCVHTEGVSTIQPPLGGSYNDEVVFNFMNDSLFYTYSRSNSNEAFVQRFEGKKIP